MYVCIVVMVSFSHTLFPTGGAIAYSGIFSLPIALNVSLSRNRALFGGALAVICKLPLKGVCKRVYQVVFWLSMLLACKCVCLHVFLIYKCMYVNACFVTLRYTYHAYLRNTFFHTIPIHTCNETYPLHCRLYS